MNVERTIKSGQEQAVAAWINHLNQVRLDELFEAWRQQDINLEQAQDSLDEARKLIFEQIIARDRGGLKGMHGFIAEVAEVGVRNARNLVNGMPADTEWINNNGPADLIRNGIQIQQKFVQSGGKLSLNAVEEHLRKYPDFLKDGGKYQIPKDYFEKIQRYLAMTQEEAKLISSDNADGLSYKQWAWVQNFFKSGEIVDIEENGFITVKFGNTVKKLSLITLVVSNLLIIDEESIKQKLDEFKPLLIKEKSIPFLLTIAEENFEPYEKYIQ